MSVTINTFPPVQSFNSRSWALLAIVTLHLGFFWALTSGLATRMTEHWKPPGQMVPIDKVEPSARKKLTLPPGVGPIVELHPLPPQPPQVIVDEETSGPGDIAPPTPVGGDEVWQPRNPIVVTPSIDPAVGLSEPMYPPAEIRQQHTGTVLLSVQVLANGRVGEVRIDQSSGYPRLDASAVREARDWRFKPGTSDGVPIVMWKQVPITFRLK
jgi:protein TonB